MGVSEVSEWMKSGHGGRGGQKRPKMVGRPLYTVPREYLLLRIDYSEIGDAR